MSTTIKDTTDGARAETLAATYLKARGLRLLARNFRVRGGEIDLVAQEGGATVFVEVRLRRSSRFGGAAESITAAKRRRLILAARHWLLEHGETPCRFDCILLNRLELSAIEWIRHAFEAD
jgi:putative endonuclease